MLKRTLYYILFLFIILSLYFLSSNEISIANNLKICIRKASKFYFNDATLFFREFSKCIKENINIDESDLEIIENDVIGERKVFLPLKNKAFDFECIWLTIGIGGDATAEFRFNKKYPNCKIYGVEPGFSGNFSHVGQVIPYGVGFENSMQNVIMSFDNQWQPKKSKVLSLPYILDTVVHSRFIHFMTIDIEGYEYKILESLVGNGKFANEDITFCQIDAELHNIEMETIHPDVKNLNPIEFILNFLQDSSPYIPIFNEPYTHHPHQKITFINIVNPKCAEYFDFIASIKK